MCKQPLEQHPQNNAGEDSSASDLSFGGPSLTNGSSDDVGSHTRSTNSYERRLEQDLQTGGAWGIRSSKLGVYGVLLLAAVVTSLTTYWVVLHGEQDLRHAEFHRYSKHIVDTVQARVENSYSLARDLSVSVTAGALDSGSVWPNVTLSNLEERTEEFFARTGADFIVFCPRVPRALKETWEAYALSQVVDDDFEQTGIVRPYIHPAVNATIDHNKPYYAPLWQQTPPSLHRLQDLMSLDWFFQTATQAADLHQEMFSHIVNVDFLMDGADTATDPRKEQLSDPHSTVLSVVYELFEEETDEAIRGYVLFSLLWTNVFTNLLPPGTGGFVVTLNDGCGTSVSYSLDGTEAQFAGWTHDGDFAPTYFDASVNDSFTFNTLDPDSPWTTEMMLCPYQLAVYPTAERMEGTRKQPTIYATAIFFLFTLAGLIFFCYDHLMLRRQKFLEHRARQTTAIVSSLFPEKVHKRLLDEMDERQQQAAVNGGNKVRYLRDLVKDKMEHQQNADSAGVYDTPPIAELFPACTVMFADIAGFTAWSSTREPTQVFVLLETLYHEIDVIAQRRRVFKVETIGDCYVAVAGLPTARTDHAIVMCRFARDCLEKTNTVTKQLEERLGPDTGDLCMRIGLHSGPVTAGVLRGEKARFQLFGDTVNTTARIESLGAKNRIHVSEDTARCIIDAGKEHWVREREHKVSAKGKGKLKTFWVDTRQRSNSVASGQESQMSEVFELPPKSGHLMSSRPGIHVDDSGSIASSTASLTNESDFMESMLTEKEERLVKWNVDVLSKLIRRIMARRQAAGFPKDDESALKELEQASLDQGKAFEEVKEVITLPQFDPKIARREVKAETIELDKAVVKQLHKYIVTIAAMYHPNAFHNFEHVSHVTMSVVKLLSRIVAPDLGKKNVDYMGKTLHDHTYGITSDPLTQFAVVFSALIHDVDHQGVSNAQLIKEGSMIAGAYENRSVAEQNSLDISWALLMDEGFYDLRRVLYTTVDEFHRLRQLVVNAVMATDIMDKELSAARKARWEKAFSTDVGSERYHVNRKATIVIEHLIQASDVSHTMQHWHVYRKWNARLFEEMRRAHKDGRMEKDPAEGWYEGEKGFFDFYIIPLAKKLKDCGVFGVSSDEYLNYAVKNREEWEMKGKEIVADMIQKFPLG